MAKDKPHGPVSERLMRNFYGPSGYVSNTGGGNLADPVALPACMAPDGADPCAAYTRLAADNEKLRKELDRLLAIEDAAKSQPQEAQPVAWQVFGKYVPRERLHLLADKQQADEYANRGYEVEPLYAAAPALCAAAVEKMLDLEKEAAIARSAGEQLLARVDIEAERAQRAEEANRNLIASDHSVVNNLNDEVERLEELTLKERKRAERAEAERDALRQDAERYRLLRGWIDAARSAT